jgi:sulfur carrier protein
MEIRVNGRPTQCDDGATVASLIESLEVTVETDAGGIAVAVNNAVVPRAQWGTTTLKSGDDVEIIHAVQGG